MITRSGSRMGSGVGVMEGSALKGIQNEAKPIKDRERARRVHTARRGFRTAGLRGEGHSHMSVTDLTQASAAELSTLYRSRSVSPVETMTAILARAEVVNPRINALCLIDTEAALAAARSSEERW